MRIPPLVVGIVTLGSMIMTMASCLRETSPAAPTGERGHEEAAWPGVIPQPPAAPAPGVPAPAAAPSKPRPPLLGCRSIEERLASIVKSAPDAKVERIPEPNVKSYVLTYNRANDAHVIADDVAIVTSALWGSRALVLFERKGCETGTEQIEIMAPSPG